MYFSFHMTGEKNKEIKTFRGQIANNRTQLV